VKPWVGENGAGGGFNFLGPGVFFFGGEGLNLLRD